MKYIGLKYYELGSWYC